MYLISAELYFITNKSRTIIRFFPFKRRNIPETQDVYTDQKWAVSRKKIRLGVTMSSSYNITLEDQQPEFILEAKEKKTQSASQENLFKMRPTWK